MKITFNTPIPRVGFTEGVLEDGIVVKQRKATYTMYAPDPDEPEHKAKSRQAVLDLEHALLRFNPSTQQRQLLGLPTQAVQPLVTLGEILERACCADTANADPLFAGTIKE